MKEAPDFTTRYELRSSDRRFVLDVKKVGQAVSVSVDGKEYRVSLAKSGEPDKLEAYIDGRPVQVSIADETEYSIVLSLEGERLAFERPQTKIDQSRSASLKAPLEKNALSSPMPGRIVAVAAKEGQRLKAGEPILIIESMKMESVISAEREVVIDEVLVKQGEAVKRGQVLIRYGKTGGQPD